jgi:hypothetical protein
MKKTTKKNSTMRKLLPAFAMLTVSAISLSSATYAWFTMNKEVEVKGLTMQATTSSGLEISLGAFGTQKDATHTVSLNSPTKNDISWKRAILVSDYYSQVGKLKPASSDDALNIFKVDETKIYAGGHAVENNATISDATQGGSAAMTLQEYSAATKTLASVEKIGEADATGYYIDIPMWIRSSNSTAEGTNVYATVTITDPNAENGSELIKAARVAIIPVGKADAEEDGEITNSYASQSYTATSTNPSTITALETNGYGSGAASIFGLEAKQSSPTASMDASLTGAALSWPTYHGKVINNTGAYKVSGDSGVTLGATTINGARGLGETSIAPTNVFTIPAATADDYGRVGFVARVWLEGESIYCEDATANQDWNIEFHFSTENKALADYTVTP